MPADPAGVIHANNTSIAIARDGKSYANNYARIVVSDLYLLDGVR